jgi:hypothetical protein
VRVRSEHPQIEDATLSPTGGHTIDSNKNNRYSLRQGEHVVAQPVAEMPRAWKVE